MNTKTSWILLALVLLAVLFVPLVPQDAPIECESGSLDTCDEGVGYVSLYSKYFSHK